MSTKTAAKTRRSKPPLPAADSPLWGSIEIPEGEARRWQLGPFTLWVRRDPEEWLIAHRTGDDPLDPQLEVARPADTQVPEGSTLLRVADGRAGLRLSPALADRAVVARPEHPFTVPPGREVSFFVTTPVWLRLVPEAENGTEPPPILELPAHRPSDTWFGRTTLEGELCYSVRACLRRNLENVPRCPHLAITKVQLVNRSRDNLLLERLNLPVPSLALLSSEDGGLWTPLLVVERQGTQVEVRFERQAPPEAGPTGRLAEPRQEHSKNMLVRALGSLLD